MDKKVILIEPYYTGSHRQLIDLIRSELVTRVIPVDLVTMSGKKWHWRARTSALYISQNIPTDTNYHTIFASSVLPLQELLGLRPDLSKSRKIIYFHENQLVYPVRKSKDRDFQYGYNQILSCMVADVVVFNSNFNMESFLSNLTKFFKLQPDYRPKKLREVIEPKCRVLYFPLHFDQLISTTEPIKSLSQNTCHESTTFRILWPHRWEFDKNPELFFKTLFKLVDEGLTNFRLSILGENFTENLRIFDNAKEKLGSFVDHFGYLPNKVDYYNVLRESDIVVSTALHEFFGVAMMEAVYLGCFPLCPNRLVYPELFKPENLFNNDDELFEKLKKILQSPISLKSKCKINFSTYDWKVLKFEYLKILIE